jgi:hypothetical protein
VKHIVRTNLARDDVAFNCVMQVSCCGGGGGCCLLPLIAAAIVHVA